MADSISINQDQANRIAGITEGSDHNWTIESSNVRGIVTLHERHPVAGYLRNFIINSDGDAQELHDDCSITELPPLQS